jgi:DNA-binding CsgD family transcriptional regulator
MAAHTATERETLRHLMALFTVDPDWLPSISHALTDAIHDEVPQLDDDLRPATYASTESVLRLMADMVARERSAREAEPPQAAVDFARELVRRGVSIDALLRAYGTGHATFFGIWVEAIEATLEDPAAKARAVELGAAWTFDYVQKLIGDLVTRYSEERERWVCSAAAVRSEIVRALLGGERPNLEAAGRRLRYELDRHHVAYVVWIHEDCASDRDPGAVERLAADVAPLVGGRGTLVVPLGRNVVGAWTGAREPLEIPPPAALPVPDACIAFGSPGAGVEGFCRSHREAMHARRVTQLAGRRSPGVVRYADVALAAVGSVDPELARDFVGAELGGLAGDDDGALRLAATLQVYLEEHCSPRRAARRLGVHENTVKNRIRSAEELLGHPVDERVAELLVALRLARVVSAR